MEALLPFVVWSFATLDRTTGEAHVSADLNTSVSNTSDYDGSYVDIIVNRLDLYGEVPLGAGFGVVGVLPLTYVRHQYEGSSELNHNFFGLGAVSVGGYYDRSYDHVGGGRLSIRPRLDVVLPTSSFEGDFDPRRAQIGIVWNRLAESADDSGSAWVRGGLVTQYRRGPWTGQLDLMVKYAFDERIDSDLINGQVPYLSVGAGVGRELGDLQATAEVVVADVGLGDTSSYVSSLSTAVISLAGCVGGDVELRGHFGIPLDEYLRTHVLIFGVSASRPL